MSYLIATLVLLSSGLSYDVPDGWKSEPTGSSMRTGQWRLPGGDDGRPDAQVILFYFGAGSGGSVEANLERWFSQFEQPDGSATGESARVRRLDVGPLRVTRADVSGTYVAPVRPGSSEQRNEPDYRMIAAVIEGGEGPWFLRLLGPASTVSKWEKSFDAFLMSLSIEK